MEFVWIPPSVALAVHEAQLKEHGGATGVRDAALLESALARPKQHHAYADESSLATLAMLYASAILKNHPFVDGNKRTALVLCESFLNMNGWFLHADETEIYRAIVDLASGEISDEDFADWLDERISDSAIPPVKGAAFLARSFLSRR